MSSFLHGSGSRSLLTSLCHFVGEGNGCSIYMHVKILMGLTFWCAANSVAFVFPSL